MQRSPIILNYQECSRNPAILMERSRPLGRTLLHSLCMECEDLDAQIIEMLIELCPDALLIADNDGYLPVHMSAQKGSCKILNCIINANPNCVLAQASNGRTALHFAAQNKHISLVKLLLRISPGLARISCTEGRLPLHLAAEAGCIVCIELLAEEFPEALASLTYAGRFSPLYLAAEFNHFPVVVYLHSKFQGAATVADSNGLTPLLASLIKKNTAVCRLLIEINPASLDIIQGVTGHSALHMSCFLDDLSVTKMICAYDPQLIELQDLGGHTPMHICAQNNFLEHFRYLHSLRPAAMSILSSVGRSPLHFAAQLGNSELVAYIIQQDPSLSTQACEDGGFLPIHLAAYHGHRKCVLDMLQMCPQVACMSNNSGWFPLHSYLIGSRILDPIVVGAFLDCNTNCVRQVNGLDSGVESFMFKLGIRSFTLAARRPDLPPIYGGIVKYPTLEMLKELSPANLAMLRRLMLIDPSFDYQALSNVQWIYRAPVVLATFAAAKLDCVLNEPSMDLERSLKTLFLRLYFHAEDSWKYIVSFL